MSPETGDGTVQPPKIGDSVTVSGHHVDLSRGRRVFAGHSPLGGGWAIDFLSEDGVHTTLFLSYEAMGALIALTDDDITRGAFMLEIADQLKEALRCNPTN